MHVRTFGLNVPVDVNVEIWRCVGTLDVDTCMESAKLGVSGGPAVPRSTERPRITVLGAGVIGLSTAVVSDFIGVQ